MKRAKMDKEEELKHQSQQQQETMITKRTTRGSTSHISQTTSTSSNTFSSSSNSSEDCPKSSRKRPTSKDQQNLASLSQMEQRSLLNSLSKALKKDPSERNDQEKQLLKEWSCLIPEVEQRKQKNDLLKQRSIEHEESQDSIEKKATNLAQLIRTSKSIIVYTGAGISTSASIPDYRGPNGLWTQLKKTGTFSITKILNLAAAEPTYTHMAIKELCKRKIVDHVVSQNCDGLHLRSGLPSAYLSEIHGNMYIEVCATCNRLYHRLADVTEKTSRFHHKTGRKCHDCQEPNNGLIDTIVLYGERSKLNWPMNWSAATKAARKANLIICMGSSLKTLRRYEALWPKKADRTFGQDTKLVIINLQYTSKDKNAFLKINGKCDDVMKLVMQRLDIKVPSYNWRSDPLLSLHTHFSVEEKSHLKRILLFQDQTRTDNKPSLKESPNLISEISDDPETKQVKMRIRINTHPSLSTKMDQTGLNEKSNLDVNAAIPGWLGKSLTGAKNPSFKRKKHGNKGKKRGSKKVKLIQEEETNAQEEEKKGATESGPYSTNISFVEKVFPKPEITIKTES